MSTEQSRAAARARREFERGIRHLGLLVGNRAGPLDLVAANAAFRSATDLAPWMADAWLGRYATGDTDFEVIAEMLRTSAYLHQERGRLSLDVNCFGARFDIDEFGISVPLSGLGEIAGLYARCLLVDGKLAEAAHLLSKVREDLSQTAQYEHDLRGLRVLALVKAEVELKGQRWPDVIATLVGSEQWSDAWMRTAAHYAVGLACALLGMLAEAERRLSLAEAGPIAALVPGLMGARGLVRRATGDNDGARSLFERSFARDPSNSLTVSAMKDPEFGLRLTSAERIATRTDPWDPATEQTPEAAHARTAAVLLAEASTELDAQIGLSAVKDQIKRMRASVELAKIRNRSDVPSRHLIFTGPPGTGKTTVARIVAKIFCGLGLLRTTKMVEVGRADLVGEFLGETAQKTHAVVDSALDGVLFIDEAYNLFEQGLHGGDAYGAEAVAALIARMENDRDRLVVIIAGYADDIDRFLASNEGLASRFRTRINFGSYSAEELGAIAEAMAQQRGSTLSPAARAAIVDVSRELATDIVIDGLGGRRRALDVRGNARFARNLIETAEEERDFRHVQGAVPVHELTPEVRDRIEKEDVAAAMVRLAAGSGQIAS